MEIVPDPPRGEKPSWPHTPPPESGRARGLVEAHLHHGYLPRMRSRLLGAFACGLLSFASAAQVGKQEAGARPAPAVTVLGEVDVHHVMLNDRVQTVIDAFYASRVRGSGAASHL